MASNRASRNIIGAQRPRKRTCLQHARGEPSEQDAHATTESAGPGSCATGPRHGSRWADREIKQG
eukprot:3072343-Pyramimonas_sp.AAC.1